MPAIEDLHSNQNTEVFLFNHSPDNRQALWITSDTLFPANDPFWFLLHSFLQRTWLPNVLYDTELGFLANRREQDFVS